MRNTDHPAGSHAPAPRTIQGPQGLLDRILDTPHLAQVVPQLQPEALHRIIQTCGLEDCGEIVVLATPGQLAQVFDLDLWRAGQPGLDEQFDADRFGVWLDVLVESGAAVAAETLAKMEVDLVIAGLAQHVRVFDLAAGVHTQDDVLTCEIGGYGVDARRTDSWNAIVAALLALDAKHQGFFHRVMRGCRSLSSSTPEIDGLDDLLTVPDQVMFTLALHRERRRERQGYATPAQARAFLRMSRTFRFAEDATPPVNPVARAYFRAIESPTAPAADADSTPGRLPAASGAAPTPEDSSDAVAAVVGLLLDAGVLAQPPRALLEGPTDHMSRLARIQAQMQFARDRDPVACSTRIAELAYLANTIVVGCSIQARALASQEALQAAVAVCNLGLENWPSQPLPDDFLVEHDLVSVFQVGWTVLYESVCMYSAERLIEILVGLRSDDRAIQAGLRALRMEMKKHWKVGTPWKAREALDVVTILDMPAWATLLGLIDEFPVIHAGMSASPDSRARAISASAFEFISENSQIASVHDFMQSLPDILRRR